MTQAEQNQATEIGQKLSVRLQKGLTFSLPKAEEVKHLEQLALELAAKVYFGKIAFAGQAANGIYNVQFNADNGTGYSSVWPVWAFELAKSALLYDKRLVIIANGDPFGSNLVQVLIFSQ
jgi:hypothetical protein